MQGPSPIALLSSEARRTQAIHRSMLLKQLSSLTFLLRKGLCIRGHKESEGNLIQLLELQSNNCLELKQWLLSNHNLSHDIVNELITLMGNTLLHQRLTNIHAVRCFSVIADETRDISNNEQLAIIICCVDINYDIHEDLIGMVHVLATTSATLTAVIKDVLIHCILPLDLCRDQAYDGAANMMGHLSGVAKQDEQPAAIKVHCLAHSLNLCLQDTAEKCQLIRTALDNTMELCKLIRYSPKRTLLLQECKQELSIGGTGLRPLCPTRWTVRTGAINAVLKNYPTLLQALQTTADTCYNDYGRRANSIFTQLHKFDTYFGLKLSHLIFSGTEQTSINL